MDTEVDIQMVLTSLRDRIGFDAQEKAILLARIAQLETELKGKNE